MDLWDDPFDPWICPWLGLYLFSLGRGELAIGLLWFPPLLKMHHTNSCAVSWSSLLCMVELMTRSSPSIGSSTEGQFLWMESLVSSDHWIRCEDAPRRIHEKIGSVHHIVCTCFLPSITGYKINLRSLMAGWVLGLISNKDLSSNFPVCSTRMICHLIWNFLSPRSDLYFSFLLISCNFFLYVLTW